MSGEQVKLLLSASADDHLKSCCWIFLILIQIQYFVFGEFLSKTLTSRCYDHCRYEPEHRVFLLEVIPQFSILLVVNNTIYTYK